MAAILICRCTKGAGVGDYSSLSRFDTLPQVRLSMTENQDGRHLDALDLGDHTENRGL